MTCGPFFCHVTNSPWKPSLASNSPSSNGRSPLAKLDRLDRLFWIVLRRLWEGWCEALIIVKAETVVSWHRAGFRRFWRWRSQRRRPGRPQANAEIRQLIRRMKADNPTWGAPRIHGELLRLGFDISEPTVSRYLHKRLSGLRAERSAGWPFLAAFDFFTVASLTFRTLYYFFVNRAWSPTDPTLQRHGASGQRVDGTSSFPF